MRLLSRWLISVMCPSGHSTTPDGGSPYFVSARYISPLELYRLSINHILWLNHPRPRLSSTDHSLRLNDPKQKTTESSTSHPSSPQSISQTRSTQTPLVKTTNESSLFPDLSSPCSTPVPTTPQPAPAHISVEYMFSNNLSSAHNVCPLHHVAFPSKRFRNQDADSGHL
jgi:hypothetical protein